MTLKSLTQASLFFFGAMGTIHMAQWEAGAVGLKVSAGPCHDGPTAFAGGGSGRALIGDHVCTCDPS